MKNCKTNPATRNLLVSSRLQTMQTPISPNGAGVIRRVLAATDGNRILCIERKTLYRKLERMGLA